MQPKAKGCRAETGNDYQYEEFHILINPPCDKGGIAGCMSPLTLERDFD